MSLLEKKNNANYVLTSRMMGLLLFILGSLGIRARTTETITLFLICLSIIIYDRIYPFQIDSYKKWWMFATTAQICFFIAPNARHPETLIKSFLYVILVTILLFMIRTDWKELSRLFRIMEVISLLASVYIIFFRIFPKLYLNWIVPHLGYSAAQKALNEANVGYGAALGDSYTYGDYLIMMGIAAFLGEDAAFGRKRIYPKIFIMICLSGMIMEGRKGELLSAIFVLLCMYIFCKEKTRTIRGTTKKLFFVTIMLISVANILSVAYKNGYLYRFYIMYNRIIGNIGGDFSTGRLERWKTAFEIFLSHPLWGVGWGGYTRYLSGKYIANIDKNMYASVHNCFLQLLCETGIIGTCLILFPYLLIFIKTYKHNCMLRKNNYADVRQGCCTIFSLSIQLFFFFIFFLDPVFYNQYFWIVYMIAVAVESYSMNLRQQSINKLIF